MSNDDSRMRGSVRHLWEALFALYLAFLGVVSSTASFAVQSALSRMEHRINVFLHLPQTDFVSGYFALWAPSVAGALPIWLVLRLSARTRLTQEILRSFAGIVTIAGPFVFWVAGSLWASADGRSFWPVGWVHGGAPFEMAAAITCAVLFPSGKWRVPSWVGALLVTGHYVFWHFARVNPYSNPSDPFSPVAFGTPLGLCAALTWGLYVGRLRRAETLGRAVGR